MARLHPKRHALEKAGQILNPQHHPTRNESAVEDDDPCLCSKLSSRRRRPTITGYRDGTMCFMQHLQYNIHIRNGNIYINTLIISRTRPLFSILSTTTISFFLSNVAHFFETKPINVGDHVTKPCSISSCCLVSSYPSGVDIAIAEPG